MRLTNRALQTAAMRQDWPTHPARAWLRIRSLAVAGIAAAVLLVAGCGGSSHTISATETSTSANISKIGGARLVYRVLPTPQSAVTGSTVAETLRILEKRAAQLGVPEDQIQTRGTHLISVGLPHVQNTRRAEQLLGTTARLEFYDWEANALTPTGRTVASLLLTRDSTAMQISQGTAPGPPGSPGVGSMPLYRAVRLAAKQPYSASKDNARPGPEYFAFGAPGSTACATAARDQHTVPFVGQHCYLAGPADNLQDLYSSLPANVSKSEAEVLTVRRGTVVLQAVPGSFTDAPAWSDPTAQCFVLRDHVSIFGTDVTNPRQSTQSGQPYVTFGFTGKGSTEFQNVTAQIAHRGALVSGFGEQLNQHFAVALDTQLLTVPMIDSKTFPNGIPGNSGGAIAGPFTIQSARDLATELRPGPLPVNLKLIAVVPHH